MEHSHKCDTCGTIWSHKVELECTKDEYHKAHDCPSCGENQREIHISPAEKEIDRARLDAVKDDISDYISAHHGSNDAVELALMSLLAQAIGANTHPLKVLPKVKLVAEIITIEAAMTSAERLFK